MTNLTRAQRRLLADSADAALQVLATHGRGAVLGDLSPSRMQAVAIWHSRNLIRTEASR